jgi:hypothetical protein
MVKEAEGFQAGLGHLSRVMICRLKPGTDLIEGLIKVCDEYGIANGAILSCIGSLKRATILSPVPKEETVLGVGYGKPIEVAGPIELLVGGGLICRDPSGQTLIHFHGVISDTDLRLYGGHFRPGGNPVMATVEAVIGEIKGVELRREYDDQVGFVVTYPYTLGGCQSRKSQARR